MTVNFVFYVAFFGQIVLISYFLPRKIGKNVDYVLNNFPPEDYPKLYPMPQLYYGKRYRGFQLLCRAILAMGLVLLGLFISGIIEDDMQTTVPLLYFFIQYIPVVLVEIVGRKQLKLMRRDESLRTRKASLQPRRLLDVVPKGLGYFAAAVYCGFIILTISIELYATETANGFFSLAIVSCANLFFLSIVLWNLYGRNQDPYRSEETRLSQTTRITQALLLINIAATLFVSFTLILDVFQIESAEGISLCFYLQLISLLNMASMRIDNVDFEVYRDSPALG